MTVKIAFLQKGQNKRNFYFLPHMNLLLNSLFLLPPSPSPLMCHAVFQNISCPHIFQHHTTRCRLFCKFSRNFFTNSLSIVEFPVCSKILGNTSFTVLKITFSPNFSTQNLSQISTYIWTYIFPFIPKCDVILIHGLFNKVKPSYTKWVFSFFIFFLNKKRVQTKL